MGQIAFEMTALRGTNKTGKLPCDDEGYYTLVVGAINALNSAGALYEFEESRKVFESSAPFIRRVNDGCIYAELDHPRKEPNWSFRDYIKRLLEIRQDRICAHIKEVRLDNQSVKDDKGNYFMAVIAKVKPCGPYGTQLKEALENQNQNVCFSIRSLTDDKWIGGLLVKALKTVITFDCVLEPGIPIAKKWYSPALEAFESLFVTKDLLSDIVADRMHAGLGAEDALTASIESAIQTIDWSNQQDFKIPPSMKW